MIVVDVEMSGLDVVRHGILSVGAVDFERPERRFYRECRLRDGADVDDAALAVNGFTREQVADPGKPSEQELIAEFMAWFLPSDDRTLGGQNTATDRDFLQAAADRARHGYRFGYRLIDLHSIAWAHLRSRGLAVPLKDGRTDLSADVIYPMVGLPTEPKPHHGLTGALMEAEAIARLLHGKNLLPEYAAYPMLP